MKVSYLIISFFIFCTLLTLYILFTEFNPKYFTNNYNEIINNSLKNKYGTLFIGTHNYEHKDIFITLKYFKEYHNNSKFYMLFADKTWNYLLEPFRPNNIEFIYVKENTVNKLSAKLLLGHNIIMFLYNESSSTGPFYIYNNIKNYCKTYLFKIKIVNNENNLINQYKLNENIVSNHYNSDFLKIFINNFGKEYLLEFMEFTEKTNNKKTKQKENKEIFMKNLKEKLYFIDIVHL